MPDYRSWATTRGRTMAGTRALWRATGMTNDDFNKAIIAISNFFSSSFPDMSISRTWASSWSVKLRNSNPIVLIAAVFINQPNDPRNG